MYTDKKMLQMYLEMQQNLKPTLSIEVGAYDADYSKAMVQMGVESFAFEASPFVYDKFKNEMHGIKYINKAVSDKNGIIEFEYTAHQNPRIVAYNSIKKAKRNELYKYIDVESITLNSYFNDRKNEKIALWIDCEGANKEVLLGATEILPSVQSILIETEYKELWSDQWLHEDVVKFLNTFGFELKFEKKAYIDQNNSIFVKTK